YSNQCLADQEEARKKKRKKRAALRTPSRSLPSPPPPPPPLAGASSALGSAQQAGSEAPNSSKPAASIHQSMAYNTSDTRFESTDFTEAQELSPTDSLMQDDSISDEQVHLSDDEDSRMITYQRLTRDKTDIENNWASTLVSTYETPAKNSLLAKTRDMTTFMKWYRRQTNPKGDQVRVDVNQPLPLGGPSGHVTIQPQFFFNKDLEYLRYGSNPTLSISKMKAASYPNFILELLVPKQMWIDDVCTYDISAKYGISYWWFNRQKFYIDRHDSLSHRKDVRTHMRILSVVRIKAYSRYGYDYLSKIVLRRADFQEHTIAEKDFKNLYPSDFEDLKSLLLQGHLDHLPGSNKWMLSTTVKLWTRNLLNLTKLGWDATGYKFKHDYTIIESPRAVVFPVNNNEQNIMRFNKIYKFSDGTLTRILESLDYRVKEFKVKRLNPGMNTRFWTEKDVTKSKEFIEAIERRLKTRRIYQNLECFIGRRVYDINYRLLQRT
ncbi:hypothetical protein Tco_1477717, partial [Tanacetum coccineum]